MRYSRGLGYILLTALVAGGLFLQKASFLIQASPVREGGTYLVTFVPDGDTVRLENGEWVRLIGVDAPELHHPEKGEEAFGKEAGGYLKARVHEEAVRLEFDPNQERDDYGRLLAYVWKGNSLINADLIRRGYARAYRNFPYDRKQEFLKLEEEAREHHRGLWKPTR